MPDEPESAHTQNQRELKIYSTGLMKKYDCPNIDSCGGILLQQVNTAFAGMEPEKYASINNIVAYGKTILNHEAPKLKKGCYTCNGDSIDDVNTSFSEAADPREIYEAALMIEELLAGLSMNEAALLEAHDICGKSFEELSSEWKIPAATLRKRHERMMEKCREILKGGPSG